ncbi:hypothetical protein ACFUJR_38070 [Streptomyces sp. NPDC057271]|uniref:hypothetical protein n=1 Tax=unclassified Streptomyces TaxID=2593676 RepID=UPI003632AA69
MAELPPDTPPMGWFEAGSRADALLAIEGSARRGSFGHRAAHDVLTMTGLFTHREGFGEESLFGRLSRLRHRMASDTIWMSWCAAYLDGTDAAWSDPDLRHARMARDWLWGRPLPLWDAARRGPILAGRRTHHEEPGWSLGLRLAREALDRRLLTEVGLAHLLGRWVPVPCGQSADAMVWFGRIDEVVWAPDALTTGAPPHPLAFRIGRGEGSATVLVPADPFSDTAAVRPTPLKTSHP